MATDENTMQAGGPDAAFEQILHDTHHIVRAYIAGIGVSSDQVDDVAQDVYLAFHKGMGSMPADVEPVRWLKGIAKRQCMNYFRRTKREMARQQEALADILASTDEESDSCGDDFLADSVSSLRQCVEKLTEKSRALLKLKYEQNLDADAIGSAIHMNPGSVRMALLRMRETLRNCMASHAGGELAHE